MMEKDEIAREMAKVDAIFGGPPNHYDQPTKADDEGEKAGPVGDMGPRTCGVCGEHYAVDDGNIECPFCDDGGARERGLLGVILQNATEIADGCDVEIARASAAGIITLVKALALKADPPEPVCNMPECEQPWLHDGPCTSKVLAAADFTHPPSVEQPVAWVTKHGLDHVKNGGYSAGLFPNDMIDTAIPLFIHPPNVESGAALEKEEADYNNSLTDLELK